MTSPTGFLAYTLLQYLVICAVVLALCDLCRRLLRLDDLANFCAAALALGVIGYLLFWIAFANYAVYAVVKIVVLAALLIHCGAIVWQRRLASFRWLAEPLLYATLFALIVVTLGFSNGELGDPARTAQNRFSHPLPADNILPLAVAEGLKAGHIVSPFAGDWLVSDRPPLQTGLFQLLALRNHELAYEVVCAWLQASFLFGVWGVAVAAKIPVSSRRLILLACCLLPTAIINTFFTWPKMLTVGYLLLVFALLFCRRPEDDRERVAFGVLIGGLAALAVLSHGGSVIALLGFAVVVVVFWAWPPLKTMIYGFAAIVTLYLPWMMFQNFVDPPGNRLLKWHLAGVTDVDGRSFGQALRDQYGALSWDAIVQRRLANLDPLIGLWPGPTITDLIAIFGFGSWNPAGTRWNDFFRLLPSLHTFSFALVCALLMLPFLKADQRPQRDAALRMLVALVATLTVFVLLMFLPGGTVNHQGTYAVQVLATMCAFTVLTLRAPPIALAFIAVQAVTVSAAYAFSLKHDPALWPLPMACVAATLALAGYSLGPGVRRSWTRVTPLL
jgi:hypothetical protein